MQNKSPGFGTAGIASDGFDSGDLENTGRAGGVEEKNECLEYGERLRLLLLVGVPGSNVEG